MARLTRRTFAVEAEVSEKIDDLVGGYTIEANLLANEALRRYIEWGRFVDSFKLVTIDPGLLKRFWSHMAVEEAGELGTKNANSTVVEFILYNFGKFDLDALLKTFRVIGAEYSNVYVYSEFGDDTNRTIILRHGMGPSASAFSRASLKALCDRLGMGVELEENDDQVVCKVRSLEKTMSVTSNAAKQ